MCNWRKSIVGTKEDKKTAPTPNSDTAAAMSTDKTESPGQTRKIKPTVPGKKETATAATEKKGEASGPPKIDVFEEKDLGPTEFRRFYDRGDLPIAVLHKAGGNKVLWKLPIEKLDYFHFLPIFFDGLRETKQPYEFLAREALLQMLKQGGQRILPVVPQLIIPIKSEPG
jgi:hypothetical protein